MDERLQIAAQLMAAMLGQAITDRYADFSQFDLSVTAAEDLALNAYNLANALLNVHRDILRQQGEGQFYPGMQYE